MRNEVLSNTLMLLLASIVAFTLVPIFMIGQSPGGYTFVDIEMFFKGSIFYAVFYGVLLTLINVVFLLLKQHKISIFFSYFILSWVSISGFLLPVSINTVMVSPIDNPIDFYNLAFVLVVSVLFSILGLTVFKKYINIFILILVVVPLVQSISAIYKSDIMFDDTFESRLVSDKKNIFVISFDGMPGNIVNRILRSNETYSDELKDFVVFEQAVSQSGTTAVSLVGDIYGIKDYTSIIPDEISSLNAVKEKLKKDFSSVRLSSHIKDSYQFGYSDFDIKPLKVDNRNKIPKTFSLFDYVIIRIYTNIGLTINNYIFSDLPVLSYLAGEQSSINMSRKLQQHKGASWDVGHILTLNVFDNFVSNVSTSKKEISLRYFHFSFTHFPIDLDSECNYRSDDGTWYGNNQNEIGIENENTCAIKKLIGFIEKLKKLEIYNNSLIVFKSDHGKYAKYYSKPPNNLLFNNHPVVGYNRHRPTLMIKPFSSNKPKITYKSEVVVLPDIAKTLCEESKLNLECNRLNGVNLLSDSLENNIPYYIFLDIPNALPGFGYYKSVKIPFRDISFHEALLNSKSIDLKEFEKK